MNEISENTLNEELNKLLMVKIQFGENYSTEYNMEIQNSERRNSERYVSHNESLNLRDNNN